MSAYFYAAQARDLWADRKTCQYFLSLYWEEITQERIGVNVSHWMLYFDCCCIISLKFEEKEGLWCLLILRLRVISLLESEVPSLPGVIISLEPSVRLVSAVDALSVWVCVCVQGTEDATALSHRDGSKGPQQNVHVFLHYPSLKMCWVKSMLAWSLLPAVFANKPCEISPKARVENENF